MRKWPMTDRALAIWMLRKYLGMATAAGLSMMAVMSMSSMRVWPEWSGSIHIHKAIMSGAYNSGIAENPVHVAKAIPIYPEYETHEDASGLLGCSDVPQPRGCLTTCKSGLFSNKLYW